MPSRRDAGPSTLTQQDLNRALLARQLLLERSKSSIVSAVEQVGGLQAQYAPSGYVGLWTRVAGLKRDDLTRALEDRSVVQATLMRTTIHIVSRRKYWRYAMGVRRSRQEWAMRTNNLPPERKLLATADRLREALADGPRTVRELGDLAKGFLGLEHLVRAYLRAFGPAPWKDIGQWAGIRVADARRGGERLELMAYLDEQGKELVDLPDAPLPDGDRAAPVRFLPHWDATLLVHARRTGLLPDAYRPCVFSTKNPFSVGVDLVDGNAAGAWSVVDGRIVLDPYKKVTAKDTKAVERQRQALEAFHA